MWGTIKEGLFGVVVVPYSSPLVISSSHKLQIVNSYIQRLYRSYVGRGVYCNMFDSLRRAGLIREEEEDE